VFTNDPALAEYQPMVQAITAAMQSGSSASGQQSPQEVAEVIWEAVHDETTQIRFVSGEGAKELLAKRYSFEQDEAFVGGMRKRFGLE